MNLEKIKEILISEPPYRKKQIYKLLFSELIEDWQKATTLPLSLRKKLKFGVSFDIKAQPYFSKDKKTLKALITLPDGAKIETVLMQYDNRNSVCLSSQVGCPLGCRFCATGKMGFRRNLTAGEIIDQVLYFARYLKKSGQKIHSLVFMGMGEPFLNYDNVLEAIKIINNKDSFNIGIRHISVSTSGIIEGINKLSQEALNINLAFSIHSADNNLRSKLMPINRKYSLPDLLKSAENYLKAKNRKVMVEYVMLGGLNDSDKDAEDLANLLQNNRHLYHVNLIQYNPTDTYTPSTKERAQAFLKVLKDCQISTSERFRFGRDINASCGQLAVKNYEKR